MNMKNSQKGFIVPLLLAIIAVLVVGGGVYIYNNKKAEVPAIVDTGTQPVNQNPQQTNNQTPPTNTLPPSNPITNTGVSTVQATTKIICSLSGNTIDDGSNQNGLTFFAQGKSCATLSGWAPNNPTNQSLTFNGVTKTWRMVLLSFYNAHFSPDGNHFAYTASSIPLPQVSAGGDWKPQRFVVSDNVAGPTYDDVYYPQYSQDGKHLGYCAYQDGQYMKIVDGVKTITTKDDYFSTCDSLFGFKQSPPTDHSQQSQGEKSSDGSYTIRQTECSAKFGCKMIVVTNNTTGVSKEYPEGRDVNASNVIFSPDSKHFAWLMGSQVYVDGNWNGKKYDEAFNLNFSSDSKSVTYNARSAKTVYFITNPIN